PRRSNAPQRAAQGSGDLATLRARSAAPGRFLSGAALRDVDAPAAEALTTTYFELEDHGRPSPGSAASISRKHHVTRSSARSEGSGARRTIPRLCTPYAPPSPDCIV